LSEERIKKGIESIIFVSDRPVTVDELLKVFTGLKRSQLTKALAELKAEWEELGRGFRLEEVSGGYRFRTSAEYKEEILRFNQSKPFKLSRAALEVLAIVSYKQPVTRIEVDRIRGVDSSGVLGMLLDKELIEVRGREEVPGRPLLYGTTDRFLEVFSLASLNDLPEIKELDELEQSAVEG